MMKKYSSIKNGTILEVISTKKHEKKCEQIQKEKTTNDIKKTD